MMCTAMRESDTDLFMRAPIEEVTRHLVRERGERYYAEVPDRQVGFPGSFSFDPTSIARPLQAGRLF